MPEWDAEVAIDEELVRALLRAQFPELDASSARLVGEGWDNAVWLVEEQWAFRFPRRQIAIPGVERELAVLPRLAPLLPVPIPEPRFVGTPTDRFRWPFFGAETAEIAELLARAEALPASSGNVLVHGDLHLRHVLVDGTSMSGVIDWGDVCLGDRAIDLQLVWSLLPAARRESFFGEYGSVDRETSLRAQVLAVYLCAVLAIYARSVGHASLERESLAGLERALTD